MLTKEKYVEYLESTPIPQTVLRYNYTYANLAEQMKGMSHDVVSNCLKRERLTARHLWNLVKGLIDGSPTIPAFLPA